ncbi:type III-B CRISPR module-associated protein Cmr5 [Hugenholtzia roseola]|uniref:type III-B CRISPR module-associated protein Cmr5 n=1 Tax=Hugenholtzia roseola TaxID=1002 RepID=UPI000479159B|nr:type III-B CRISPR module-associated protein Cmr5 [Hugenholtzia roseola]
MENPRLNIEQQRAKFAFDHRTSKLSSNYDAMVKKLPAYVQTNGFVYAMAFLAEKDKGVFETIWKWHCNSSENTMKLPALNGISKGNFLPVLINLEDEKIRLITMETLALFTWLRRFVDDEKATEQS